ncbi:MAG TPA: MBL fold metallo-hydrolase [Bacillota bacterium]|nr:MBL fold metallo-hydrolase [Bacillota bacterium]
MRLTILGCWAPYPKAGGNCSGYLVQAGDTALILDMGNGTFGELEKHLDFRSLTGVVITHMHHDHYLDLYSLRHAIAGAMRDGSRTTPLDLWLPEDNSPQRAELSTYTQVFNIHTLTGAPLRVGELDLSFQPTIHALPCLAVKVQHQGKTLVYTGDTGWQPPLVAFASQADLLLCEASLLNSDSGMTGHLTAGAAGELGRLAHTAQLVLTHFFPEYDQEALKTQAQETFGNKVDLATEGSSYIL